MTTKTQHRPEWRFEEAKAKLSQLVDQAKAGTPQLITRRGQEEVMVVSVNTWRAVTGDGPKAIELFRHAPRYEGTELGFDRDQPMIQERELDLG
jgi:antitoxin Phd